MSTPTGRRPETVTLNIPVEITKVHGHYVQLDDNFHGQTVELRFTRRESGGVECVYEEKVVAGAITDCAIYLMDDDEGRDRLAAHCVAPDMIPQR